MSDASERERRDDLAATSESLQQDARRLMEIEAEKQDLEVDDPKVDALSEEAERLAGHIQQKSRVERHLSDDDEQPSDSAGPDRSN